MPNVNDATNTAGQTWTLTLHAEPDPVPGYCRLRRFLKNALRAYGLRCTRVIEEQPAGKTGRPDFTRPQGQKDQHEHCN